VQKSYPNFRECYITYLVFTSSFHRSVVRDRRYLSMFYCLYLLAITLISVLNSRLHVHRSLFTDVSDW